MPSDSSDEEPNLELLQEACDSEFLKDSLYKVAAAPIKDKVTDSVERLRSLRPDKTMDDRFCYALPDVTPGFRRHVAKHLGEILDRTLEKLLVGNGKRKRKKGRKRGEGGVKLFGNSVEYIDVNNLENNVRVRAAVSRTRRIDEEEPDEDLRVKLAAVKADDILSGKEVKNWAVLNRGTVFRYRKDFDDNLVCIEDEFK